MTPNDLVAHLLHNVPDCSASLNNGTLNNGTLWLGDGTHFDLEKILNTCNDRKNYPFPGKPCHVQDAFLEKYAGELADILVALNHQLSTDSDLDDIGGAPKYRALLKGIREAMAKSLGYSGIEE